MDRAYILCEIRRTAAASGEVLGWRRFESETGIRQSDWSRYWARWGEATREAGLSPNDFTKAYDRGALLEKYAALTRELGRLPTSADLRVKACNEPSFPREKTFGRFKGKHELVERLTDHCRTVGGWDDVVALCDAYGVTKKIEQHEGRTNNETDLGFVYLVRSGKHYKIGKTNSVGRRERELTIQLPEKVATVNCIRTDDPAGIEAYWHRRFEAKRKNGEWFELDAADVQAFKRRRFM
jgi:hypothetical protein